MTWLSFHDGLVFSVHTVLRWNEATGLLTSYTQSFGGGNARLQPGFVGGGAYRGAAPEVGLNCGRPSNDWSG